MGYACLSLSTPWKGKLYKKCWQKKRALSQEWRSKSLRKKKCWRTRKVTVPRCWCSNAYIDITAVCLIKEYNWYIIAEWTARNVKTAGKTSNFTRRCITVATQLINFAKLVGKIPVMTVLRKEIISMNLLNVVRVWTPTPLMIVI